MLQDNFGEDFLWPLRLNATSFFMLNLMKSLGPKKFSQAIGFAWFWSSFGLEPRVNPRFISSYKTPFNFLDQIRIFLIGVWYSEDQSTNTTKTHV